MQRILNADRARAACALIALLLTGCASSPEEKEARFLKRGQEALEKREFARALLEFRNAAQVMPKDAEPVHRQGMTYLAMNDLPNAIGSFRKAVDLNPKHTDAQLKLSQLMASTGNKDLLEESISRLRNVLSASPDNPDASNAMAIAEFKLGNQEEAAARLEQALAKFPKHLQSAVSLTRLKMNQKDPVGAEAVMRSAVANDPNSTAAALALAQFYVVTRKLDKAEAEIHRVLRLDPDNTSALVSLGTLQIAGKRIGEAEETYRRLAALPDSEYLTVHAQYLIQNGKREAALEELERLHQKNTSNRQVRTQLIALYMDMNRMPRAKQLLDQALQKNASDSEALMQRSELNLRTGNIADAEKDLSAVLHFRPDYPKAHYALAAVHRAQGRTSAERQELNETLRLNPELLSARLDLARELTLAKETKSALSLLDQAPAHQKRRVGFVVTRNWALLQEGNLPELETSLETALRVYPVPDLVLQQAVLNMRKKKYAAARLDAEELLRRVPDEIRAARIIAESYGAEKQPEKALARLREVAAGRPKSAPFQHLLGEWAIAAGSRSEAKRALEAATAADRNYLPAQFSLAELEQLENRHEAAQKRLAAVVEAHPRNAEAQLMLGNVEEALGNKLEAIARYRAVLDLDSRNLTALNNLAYDLAIDKPEEALAFAQKAVELAPDNDSIQHTLGWVYYRKRMYPTAIQYLRNAAAKQPTPRRQFHLGICYIKSGDRDQGQKLIAAALAKEPKLAENETGW